MEESFFKCSVISFCNLLTSLESIKTKLNVTPSELLTNVQPSSFFCDWIALRTKESTSLESRVKIFLINLFVELYFLAISSMFALAFFNSVNASLAFFSSLKIITLACTG